jgi:hypothetical protein
MYRFAIAAFAFWANSAMAQEYLVQPVGMRPASHRRSDRAPFAIIRKPAPFI